MKITLDTLRNVFPKTVNRDGLCSVGVTGFIPMDFVVANEADIAKIVKKHGLRRIYRGPRNNPTKSWTRKDDAYAMVLYYK